MDESTIIPIQPALEHAAITSLIESKRSTTITAALTASGDGLREQLRKYYQTALDGGLLTLINMGARLLGSLEPERNRQVWLLQSGSLSITVIFHHTTSASEVTVNNILVWSNLTPGAEMCIPGEWMNAVYVEIKKAETTANWKRERDAANDREKLLTDLTADV